MPSQGTTYMQFLAIQAGMWPSCKAAGMRAPSFALPGAPRALPLRRLVWRSCCSRLSIKVVHRGSSTGAPISWHCLKYLAAPTAKSAVSDSTLVKSQDMQASMITRALSVTKHIIR